MIRRPPAVAIAVAVLVALPFPGAAAAATRPASRHAAETVAVFTTTAGPIAIRLYPKDAPRTVANFVGLVAKGFYDSLTFHRVHPGFVIQGGDPNSRDANPFNDGQGGPGYTLPAEI